MLRCRRRRRQRRSRGLVPRAVKAPAATTPAPTAAAPALPAITVPEVTVPAVSLPRCAAPGGEASGRAVCRRCSCRPSACSYRSCPDQLSGRADVDHALVLDRHEWCAQARDQVLGLREQLVGRGLLVAAVWDFDAHLPHGAGIQPRVLQLLEQPIAIRNPRRFDLDRLLGHETDVSRVGGANPYSGHPVRPLTRGVTLPSPCPTPGRGCRRHVQKG